MTTCESVRESLGAWLDGELKPADARSIQQHLDQCVACARERRQLNEVDSLLKRVIGSGAQEIAFEPFWRGVQQRIEDRRTWYAGLSEWSQQISAAPTLAWAVPVVIVLLLVLLSLDSLVPVWRQDAQRNNFASVESIDSYGRNVALFRDNETKTMVIWLYQNQEGENASSGETAEANPSF
jgi:anti-sigma factor RsiW